MKHQPNIVYGSSANFINVNLEAIRREAKFSRITKEVSICSVLTLRERYRQTLDCRSVNFYAEYERPNRLFLQICNPQTVEFK